MRTTSKSAPCGCLQREHLQFCHPWICLPLRMPDNVPVHHKANVSIVSLGLGVFWLLTISQNARFNLPVYTIVGSRSQHVVVKVFRPLMLWKLSFTMIAKDLLDTSRPGGSARTRSAPPRQVTRGCAGEVQVRPADANISWLSPRV